MKPLKLVIDGIRSFSERVEIDFESVSSSGLFGIFGSTGSGKSTILDSVIIALYGEISGLKTAELISARRKNAFISLEFEIFDKEIRRRYLVERSFKLKKDGNYGGAVASLYETTGGSALSIASLTSEVNKKIEEILGLGQNEFTKCIILPQGEFAEFVKAPKAERVKIIEKLFSLERYGERFNAKLKAKKEQVDLELLALNSSLQGFENATKENLDLVKKDLEETEKEREKENVKLLKITEYIEENTPFYNLYTRLTADKEVLLKLEQSQTEINRLKEVLKSVDFAKIIVDLSEELQRKVDCENQLSKEVENALKTLSTLKVEKENLDREFASLGDLQNEKTQLKKKSEELVSVGADVVEFKTLRKEVLTLADEIEQKKQRRVELKEQIEDLTEKQIDLSLKNEYLQAQTDATKTFSFVSDEVLKSEYAKQIDYYVKQSEKIDGFNADGECYLYYKTLILERLDEFKNLFDSLKKDGEIDVQTVVENFKNMLSKRSETVKKLGEVKGKIESLKADLTALENTVKIDEETYLKKREKLDLLNEKLLKIVGNIDDYENQLTFCLDCLNSLEKREDDIRKKREEITGKYLSEEKVVFEKKVLLENAVKERKKVDDLISENLNENISSVLDAKKILSETDDVEDIAEKIENYQKSLVYYSQAVIKAQEELEKVNFNVDFYLQKLEEKSQICQNVSNLQEKFLKCQNIVENLSQNFDKRCIIEKDINLLGARAGVLARLEQVVSRRAFSEFISAEFLSDVALQARKTLLELTGGKYDVVYKDSVESGKDGFYICDNLNGGIERSVSSLSGGETFLVSLSLALALSVGIYSRSEKPMEFFFLDEGFGTLDESLVDTVLDSLEKLRNKNFSIGLISHLSEMKSRIDSKIIVSPATETTGSTVLIKAN